MFMVIIHPHHIANIVPRGKLYLQVLILWVLKIDSKQAGLPATAEKGNLSFFLAKPSVGYPLINH